MKSFVVPSVWCAVAVLGAVAAAGEVKSGLQLGEHAGFFNVKDVTGPNAGKSLCYR